MLSHFQQLNLSYDRAVHITKHYISHNTRALIQNVSQTFSVIWKAKVAKHLNLTTKPCKDVLTLPLHNTVTGY